MTAKFDERGWLMDDKEVWSLKKWGRAGTVTPEDVWRVFHGNPVFVRLKKVTKRMNLLTEEYRVSTWDYAISSQREQFFMDMFDLSLSHRIVMVNHPWDIYLMECDAEHPDTNIDLDMIEAIVGKGD